MAKKSSYQIPTTKYQQNITGLKNPNLVRLYLVFRQPEYHFIYSDTPHDETGAETVPNFLKQWQTL